MNCDRGVALLACDKPRDGVCGTGFSSHWQQFFGGRRRRLEASIEKVLTEFFLFQPGDLFSVEYQMMNEYEKMRKTKEK